MARNKNPTALFDAIYSAKKPPKASPSASIPTPKWFGKNKPIPKVPAVESTENAGKQKSWLSRARQNVVAPVAAPIVAPVVRSEPDDAVITAPVAEQSTVDSVDSAAVSQTEPSQPKPRFIDRFVNRTPKDESQAEALIEQVAAEPAQNYPLQNYSVQNSPVQNSPADEIVEPDAPEMKPEPRNPRSPVIQLDRSAKEFHLSLSYAGLAAIGFIFITALAIAFVAGKRSSVAFDDDLTPPKGATTAPSDEMAMSVGAALRGNMGETPDATHTDVAPTHPAIHPDVLTVPPHSKPDIAVIPPVPTSPALPMSTTREIGLNYVIVQSYDQQDLAQKACDFMNKNNVPCTLVQGPSNWALHDWFSVVTLRSFGKHDPALADYERSIKTLGQKFTPRVLDQFQPQAYTWRMDSDLAQQ